MPSRVKACWVFPGTDDGGRLLYRGLMPNPYETSPTDSLPSARRAVRRHLIVAGLFLSIGGLFSVLGAVLLNQEWQVVPTYTEITDIEFEGRTISLVSVMRFSFVAAIVLLILGALLACVALQNRHHNKTIAHPTD